MLKCEIFFGGANTQTQTHMKLLLTILALAAADEAASSAKLAASAIQDAHSVCCGQDETCEVPTNVLMPQIMGTGYFNVSDSDLSNVLIKAKEMVELTRVESEYDASKSLFAMCQDVVHPNIVRWIEIWENQAALTYHQSQSHADFPSFAAFGPQGFGMHAVNGAVRTGNILTA